MRASGRRERSTGRESEVLPAMCLFLSLLLFGPRVVIVFWWIVDPLRWSVAFDSFFLPFLGLPLPAVDDLDVRARVAGRGRGLDLLWIGLAVAADLASYAGGAIGGRGRVPGYGSNTGSPS